MFGRSRFESFFALVFGIAITALSSVALGQTVSMSPSNPVVRSSYRPGSALGADNTVALTLTRNDCKDPNLKYTFNVNLTGYVNGYVLQAWAGSSEDCTTTFNAPSYRRCWKLGDMQVNNGQTATVDFTPQQLFGIGSGSSAPVIQDCDYIPDSGARQTFTAYFFLVNSDTLQGTAARQAIGYDMGAPPVPTNVSAGSAESALKVSWTPVADQSDVTYTIYCAKNKDFTSADSCGLLTNGGSGGAGGDSGTASTSGGTSSGGTASTSSDASGGSGGSGGTTDTSSGGTTTSTSSTGGTSGAGGASSTSTSTAVTIDKSLMEPCGSVRSKAASSLYTNTNLDNYVSYAVAVTSMDVYGNESDPSAVACGTPVLVDTFFERYRSYGGKAGGGFCAFAHGRGSLASAAWLLLSLGAIFHIRRRIRRGRS